MLAPPVVIASRSSGRRVHHAEDANCRLAPVELGQACLQHPHRRVGATGEGGVAADKGSGLRCLAHGTSSAGPGSCPPDCKVGPTSCPSPCAVAKARVISVALNTSHGPGHRNPLVWIERFYVVMERQSPDKPPGSLTAGFDPGCAKTYDQCQLGFSGPVSRSEPGLGGRWRRRLHSLHHPRYFVDGQRTGRRSYKCRYIRESEDPFYACIASFNGTTPRTLITRFRL